MTSAWYVFQPNGPRWKFARKQFTPAFHHMRLRHFFPFVQERSQRLCTLLRKQIQRSPRDDSGAALVDFEPFALKV